MRYKLFGSSGLRVSELALGTLTFGEELGFGASKEISKQLFDTYAEAGGNFIDTANRYTEGTSERWVGEFIASDRDHFVVATKYSFFDRKGDPNFSGNHRKNMVRSLESSLKRLHTDFVDLLWVHAWDFTTRVEEVMRALDDLVRSGKVLYVGVSDTPAWVVSRANTLAELRGWTAFSGLQIRYSLLDRSAERELLPMARTLDLAVTPWGVLGAGILTGKYKRHDEAGSQGRASRWGVAERDLTIAEVLIKVAAETDCTASQVALSWVRQQPGVIIPIIGATKVEQLQDNMACLEQALTPEHLKQLSDAADFEPGFPHDFLSSEQIVDIVSGGTHNLVDNHRI